MALIDEVRKLIKEHLNNSPKVTIASLARSADVATSTARAIMQGDIRDPAEDKLTALLLTFLTLDQVIEVLEKNSPNSTVLKLMKKHLHKPEIIVQSSQFRWVYPDHLIIGLADTTEGTTQLELERRFGEDCKRRISALMEAGILREINSRIKLVSDIYFPNINDSIEKVKIHSQGWSADEMKSGGFLYHLTDGYSDKGVELGRAAASRFIDELGQIHKDHPGSRAFILSILGSIFEGSK